VVGSVARKGIEVLYIEASLSEPDRSPATLFARRMVNAIGTPALGMRLIELAPVRESFHSAQRGEAKLTLASSPRDPLGDLHADSAAQARWLELDFAEAGIVQPLLLGEVDAEWVARRFMASLM